MTDREKGRSKKERGGGRKKYAERRRGRKKERMETGRKGWEERRRIPPLPCWITGATL
jgi:hypothetical protein